MRKKGIISTKVRCILLSYLLLNSCKKDLIEPETNSINYNNNFFSIDQAKIHFGDNPIGKNLIEIIGKNDSSKIIIQMKTNINFSDKKSTEPLNVEFQINRITIDYLKKDSLIRRDFTPKNLIKGKVWQKEININNAILEFENSPKTSLSFYLKYKK